MPRNDPPRPRSTLDTVAARLTQNHETTKPQTHEPTHPQKHVPTEKQTTDPTTAQLWDDHREATYDLPAHTFEQLDRLTAHARRQFPDRSVSRAQIIVKAVELLFSTNQQFHGQTFVAGDFKPKPGPRQKEMPQQDDF